MAGLSLAAQAYAASSLTVYTDRPLERLQPIATQF
jgi:hypothetical protein